MRALCIVTGSESSLSSRSSLLSSLVYSVAPRLSSSLCNRLETYPPFGATPLKFVGAFPLPLLLCLCHRRRSSLLRFFFFQRRLSKKRGVATRETCASSRSRRTGAAFRGATVSLVLVLFQKTMKMVFSLSLLLPLSAPPPPSRRSKKKTKTKTKKAVPSYLGFVSLHLRRRRRRKASTTVARRLNL